MNWIRWKIIELEHTAFMMNKWLLSLESSFTSLVCVHKQKIWLCFVFSYLTDIDISTSEAIKNKKKIKMDTCMYSTGIAKYRQSFHRLLLCCLIKSNSSNQILTKQGRLQHSNIPIAQAVTCLLSSSARGKKLILWQLVFTKYTL